ncbi:MAG TPA: c-type cytochrome [Ramlibacter sp.]|nr:c-type cytochrome [Ramlibacter sp.]
MKLKVAVAAAALAAAAGASLAAPDVLRGEQVYSRCIACHALASDRVGPRHCGLFGRKAGSVPGFLYSDAMRHSKITWDEKTLDLFLARPMKVIPETTMTYDGIPDARDRKDLIAYLKHAGASPECRK